LFGNNFLLSPGTIKYRDLSFTFPHGKPHRHNQASISHWLCGRADERPSLCQAAHSIDA